MGDGEEVFYAAEEVVGREDGVLGDSGEAVGAARKSTLLPETLGQEMFSKLLINKTSLWDEYRGIVTQYEMEKDLPVL